MHIKEATIDDSDSIINVYLSAFDDSEAGVVSDLAVNLLTESCTVKTISLVAMENNEIVGHTAFSPVFTADNTQHLGYILSPLAVSPEFQKKGIGSSLINHGLDAIAKLGPSIVFVYGDPNYYSRFDFDIELAKNYKPPLALQFPEGWHALALDTSALPESGEITCVHSLDNPDLW